MDKSEILELVKIAQKARIEPPSHHGWIRLEGFLRRQFELAEFSQEDREQLIAELQELPDLVRSTIVARAKMSTSIQNFHLTDDERDQLETVRDELPFHERAKWSVIRGTRAGLAWLDVGTIFTATISVDDFSCEDRASQPFAHIWFKIGGRRRVETIDIFASLARNPRAFGHPVVIAAIQHWQRVIRWKSVYERKNWDDADASYAWIQHHYSRRHVRTAERCLRTIGRMLVTSSLEQAIPEPRSLEILLSELDLHDQGCFLHEVWQEFRNWDIPEPPTEMSVEKLRANLSELPIRQRPPRLLRVTGENVIAFLTDTGEAGGHKFTEQAKKPTWPTFRNAYSAWYLRAGVRTVKNAFARVKRDPITKVDTPDLSISSKDIGIPRLMGDLLTSPLVFARAPTMIDEPGPFESIEDAIWRQHGVTE